MILALRIVEADTHALVVRLAGTFTPTREHLERAERMRVLGLELFDRSKAAGVLRPGLTFVDIGLLLEMVSSAAWATRSGRPRCVGAIST